jgi:Fic family protein
VVLDGDVGVDVRIPVSQEILTEVSWLDRFQGAWSARQTMSSERLRRLEEAADVQSIGSSCRLAGIRVQDTEVAALLRGERLSVLDASEILGYAAALRQPLPGPGRLLSSDDLRRLHAVMMGWAGNGSDRSPWRQSPLHREAFDAEGQTLGHVFATLPPRLVEEKTEELLTWLEFELRAGERHPVLVVATYLLYFFAISPFEKGNGRMMRLLGRHLLRRAGYDYVPYASIEREIDELRVDYYGTIATAQTRLWTGEADLEPWLRFFLQVLARHRRRVGAKMDLEREDQDLPPLQLAILETVREHGTADAALLIKATGANRNTLKDNLRRLVRRGVLERTGQRRGTRYRMAAGGEG